MNDLLEQLIDEAEAMPPPPTATHEPPPISAVSAQEPPTVPPAPLPNAPPTQPLLGGLLADPSVLAALPALIGELGPLLGGLTGGKSGSTSTQAGTSGSASKRPPDRHTALLCAIKPYLSHERQASAETILRLARIWDALGRSGLSLSGLLASLSGTGGGGATDSRHRTFVTPTGLEAGAPLPAGSQEEVP